MAGFFIFDYITVKPRLGLLLPVYAKKFSPLESSCLLIITKIFKKALKKLLYLI